MLLQPDFQIQTKVQKLIHQQTVNQAQLDETKHQLILGSYVSAVVKWQQRRSACVVMN